MASMNQDNRHLGSALVVEGGAMRGVFAAGVLDEFLEQGFDPFSAYFGVSAGAGNVAAFLARMPGRNLQIYTDYALRREFISLTRFLRGGHLMDLDWLWEVTIREIRLDLATIARSGKPFYIGLTNIEQGRAEYLSPTPENLEHLLKVSSALPIAYRGFPSVAGTQMADGGLADAIPVQQAWQQGARQIMVIRSRPADYRKKPSKALPLLQWLYRRHPAFVSLLQGRTERYNAALDFITSPPEGTRIIQVCPPPDFKPTRMGKDPQVLRRGYQQGRQQGRVAISQWQQLTEHATEHRATLKPSPTEAGSG